MSLPSVTPLGKSHAEIPGPRPTSTLAHAVPCTLGTPPPTLRTEEQKGHQADPVPTKWQELLSSMTQSLL